MEGRKSMSATSFEKQGKKLTVCPKGRLDTAGSPALWKEMQEYLDGVQEITMDLTNVEYISSSGLRLLLETDGLMEERGGSMQVIHANEFILDIFEMIGFEDVVTVVKE